jgi:phage shock protein A
MSEEKQISVSEMLKLTGANTAEFMKQVADHIDKLEERIAELATRISEFESQQDDSK